MNEILADGQEVAWEQISPQLDSALAELNEAERDAVMLRYFERKSAREMASLLGLSEEAAQKRANRATEKLREYYHRNGVTVGAGVLAALLSAHAVQAAPAGLAASIITALALGGAGLVSTAAITTTKAIAMTTLQKTVLASMLFTAVGVGVYEAAQNSQLRTANEALQREGEILRIGTSALSNKLVSLRNNSRPAVAEAPLSANERNELLRLRGMAGVARRANEDAEKLRARLAQQSKEKDSNGTPMTGVMGDAMKQALEQQVEGKLSRLVASLHLTPEQAQAARAILAKQLEVMSAGMQQAFTGKYNKDELTRLAKEGGDADAGIQALLSPEQKANYLTYQEEEKAYNARLVANSELLQMEGTLRLSAEQEDRVFAALYHTTMEQLSGSAKAPAGSQGEQFQWVLDQKAKAIEPLLTPGQLEIYRKQQASQAKLTKDILSKLDASGSAK